MLKSKQHCSSDHTEMCEYYDEELTLEECARRVLDYGAFMITHGRMFYKQDCNCLAEHTSSIECKEGWKETYVPHDASTYVCDYMDNSEIENAAQGPIIVFSILLGMLVIFTLFRCLFLKKEVHEKRRFGNITAEQPKIVNCQLCDADFAK